LVLKNVAKIVIKSIALCPRLEYLCIKSPNDETSPTPFLFNHTASL
jgi:hypothetical protein